IIPSLKKVGMFIFLVILAACTNITGNLKATPISPTVTNEISPTVHAIATATNTPVLTPQATRETLSNMPSPTLPSITTLLFSGVIVPARCVQAALDRSNDYDYPYGEVRDIIQQADLAVGTFNATMSEVAPHTGCVATYVLVGSPANADALAQAGFDAMSIATNHIKDCGLTNCGDRAFLDTLDNLHRVGIQTVGAGKNVVEALQPLYFNIHGVRFGILSQGQIEQGGVYATAEKAGIAPLTKENIHNAIQAARGEADVVIFMPHWGPEDSATPNWIQRNLAHIIVDEGADVVIGNHTHVVQGYQQINGSWVFYGLGNFLFDQWQRDHQQGVMLLIRFQGTKMLDFQWIPTHVDKSGRIHLADATEAAEILQRIESASKNLR
ncbi:MAG: CapA family protein, partial [Candidatus Kryptoniota bacterium]